MPLLSVVMLSIVYADSRNLAYYAESHYAESHYAESHYAECHYAESHYGECRGAILKGEVWDYYKTFNGRN
jgi:hypothetical protein